MIVVRLLPVISSMLLLSAHFYRAGHLLLASGALLSLGLLCIRHPLAVWLLQGFLGAGTAEWLSTAVRLAMFRQSQGLPWQRLVIILGLVALYTLLSTLVFRIDSLKSRYKFRQKKQPPP